MNSYDHIWEIENGDFKKLDQKKKEISIWEYLIKFSN